MKIISVIPLQKGILKGDLTYFTNLNVSVGDIVVVPLRSKKVLALATSIEELREAKSNVRGMKFNLKKILENKGKSVFSSEFLYSIFDTSKYFAQNINNTLVSLIPNTFLEEYEKIIKIKNKSVIKKGNIENTKKIKAEKLLFQYRTEDRISVYRTLIRESFARNKSIVMVLPTQFDIEKFEKQLSRGIEQFTFVVHSGNTAKKNLLTYEKIISSDHPVFILCTPPFLAIPRKDINTIILERENSNAYRTISRPHLDLRIFVEIYASRINARLIIADDILRYETIERKNTDDLAPLHPLSFRTDFTGEIEVFGRQKRNDKKFSIFSNESIKEIKFALENKRNVFIFSLRKGLATMTVCKDCHETVNCEACGAPLVLYLSHKGKKRMFVCNRCEKEIGGDIACASCGSWNLIPLGIGTDSVQEEIKKLFPKNNIFKLDKESAKSTSGAKKIISEFEKAKGAILVGTEMTFFYLKEKVSLSVIASFDSLWSIPNFKMGEKIVRILFSVIENTKEKIIIQTKNKEDSAILAIKSGNLLSFVREELDNRRELNYPPFRRFIKITHLGTKDQTIKAREELKEIFQEYSPEIYSGFITKLKNKYVTNALIKIDTRKWSLPELKEDASIDENLLKKLTALPTSFDVLIDPEDLL